MNTTLEELKEMIKRSGGITKGMWHMSTIYGIDIVIDIDNKYLNRAGIHLNGREISGRDIEDALEQADRDLFETIYIHRSFNRQELI